VASGLAWDAGGGVVGALLRNGLVWFGILALASMGDVFDARLCREVFRGNMTRFMMR
jgi:hypothetical protein